MKNLHLDIETGDPDDLWTLALLSTHPSVHLKTVSVFPGGRDQIYLVKEVLRKCGREDVVVCSDVTNDGKSRVSKYYSKWIGKIGTADPDRTLLQGRELYDGSELITGGSLRNIKKICKDSPPFTRWTCQGGFVGNNIVSDDQILDKFKGKRYVPTFNLNGDPKAALSLLARDNQLDEIQMVGKNVCHGFVFTPEDVTSFPRGKSRGLDVMIEGIESYYAGKAFREKAMHDILAALLHINPDAGQWVSGYPVRVKGMWGFDKDHSSNIRALLSVDRAMIMESLA